MVAPRVDIDDDILKDVLLIVNNEIETLLIAI